jgi:hypothetical protein
MRIERHSDPAAFFSLVAPFLERREAERKHRLPPRHGRHPLAVRGRLIRRHTDPIPISAAAAATPATRPDTWAPGNDDTAWAHVATYATTQPLSHARPTASRGANGSTAAAANESPSSTGITGSTSAFATAP